MATSPATELRRKGAGLCLIAAPALMLCADALRIGAGMTYTWLVLLKLSFAFFVAAILALVHLLRPHADRTGLAGGALGVVGCLAGASIVTTAMITWSLETAALGEPAARAVEAAMQKGGVAPFVLLYPLPGLAFPAGLLVLGFGLLRARVTTPLVALLLALGAVLFPIGRIGSLDAAVLASGLSLTVAMGIIGRQVLKWSAAEWNSVPARGSRPAGLEDGALAG